MPSFETFIHVPARVLPAPYVQHLMDQSGPGDLPYGPDDTVDDVHVEVEYRPGFYIPACRRGHPDNWYPEEGEDPEVLSVKIDDPDYKGPVAVDLRRLDVKRLESEAWNDQQNRERDAYDGDTYDPYDDYYDR